LKEEKSVKRVEGNNETRGSSREVQNRIELRFLNSIEGREETPKDRKR
jgi:hypothetical protein